MKFDIERVKQSPSNYDQMKPEYLAFQDALCRRVIREKQKDNYISYHGGYERHNRHICPYVKVTEEGKIEVEVGCFFKNEKAHLKKEDIEASMNTVLEFIEAAFEHGYLQKEVNA